MMKPTLSLLVIAALAAGSLSARAHCEIPCGIYDDGARLALISEHAGTIEKSMAQIVELSKDPAANANQLARWVANKEAHANEIQHIVSQYFMTQRIKVPAKGDEAAAAKYNAELGMLHQMLLHAMKAKQTTDPSHVEALRKLVHDFGHSYLGVHTGNVQH